MDSSVFTCGDINGIGPEIVVKSLNQISSISKQKIIFACPKNVFLKTISYILPKFSYTIVKSVPNDWNHNSVLILDIGRYKQSIGKVTSEAGEASYKSIITACKLAEDKTVNSIITAPISKLALAKAGIKFPGHTELLADFFNVKNYAMMFVSKQMKAALITIHIPLKDVPKSITKKKLITTIDVIHNSIISDFGMKNPKISILGLNPHAGEEGKIGSEEVTLLKPTLKSLNYKIHGPEVPDAYFGNKLYKKYDCTIGLYHDQVLIPFKLLNFNKGVNYTAGLPVVRTSPDHGTAFDIAGKGIANPDSIIEAFRFAKLINKNRRKTA